MTSTHKTLSLYPLPCCSPAPPVLWGLLWGWTTVSDSTWSIQVWWVLMSLILGVLTRLPGFLSFVVEEYCPWGQALIWMSGKHTNHLWCLSPHQLQLSPFLGNTWWHTTYLATPQWVPLCKRSWPSTKARSSSYFTDQEKWVDGYKALQNEGRLEKEVANVFPHMLSLVKEITRSSTTSLAVRWLGLSLRIQGVRVRSLVGDLRSHRPRGQKTKTLQQKQYCNKFNKDFKNGPHPK